MDFYMLAIQSPVLTFCCVLAVCITVYHTVYNIFFRLPNRYIRHKNIVARGWPPSHLDADGDQCEEDN